MGIGLEGWAAVRRKARQSVFLTFELLGGGLIMPIVCIVRLIRPLVLIRFGPIRSDVIGHFVFDPEYYLSKRELNKVRTIDFFYFQSSPSPNEQWALMIRRHLRVFPIVWYIDRLNQKIPGGQAHIVRLVPEGFGDRDFEGVLTHTEPRIKFTKAENKRGRRFLEELGFESNERFVCLIVRDSMYKEKYQKWGNRDWSYHNYRDCDIDTYEEAALALAEKGYWVFRMGKAVNKPFRVNHPRVLDYANAPYRSDFLDIWLMANCFFCVSTGTGLDNVAKVYNRPVVFTNFIPLRYLHTEQFCLSVPKHLIWIQTKKPLDFSEHWTHDYLQSQKYEDAGIVVRDLTPAEIKEVVLEMVARLDGSWVDNVEDKNLQKLFWDQVKSHPDDKNLHGYIHDEARVGAKFLRQNNYLIGAETLINK